MKTTHHNIEQHTFSTPDTPKRGYVSFRKTSLISEKESAQMWAVPTVFHREGVEMGSAPFEQIVKTSKSMVE